MSLTQQEQNEIYTVAHNAAKKTVENYKKNTGSSWPPEPEMCKNCKKAKMTMKPITEGRNGELPTHVWFTCPNCDVDVIMSIPLPKNIRKETAKVQKGIKKKYQQKRQRKNKMN